MHSYLILILFYLYLIFDLYNMSKFISGKREEKLIIMKTSCIQYFYYILIILFHYILYYTIFVNNIIFYSSFLLTICHSFLGNQADKNEATTAPFSLNTLASFNLFFIHFRQICSLQFLNFHFL